MSLIGERYKLGVWQDPGPAYARWDWRGKTRDQLFDRQRDPQETHNLIGRPEVAVVEKELRDALDQAVGRILDKLEQVGLTRKTVFFFFANNGAHPENSSENGALRDYKWSHYEGGMRVPFLSAYPGVFPAGLTYSEAVSTLDIFPTVPRSCSISSGMSARNTTSPQRSLRVSKS